MCSFDHINTSMYLGIICINLIWSFKFWFDLMIKEKKLRYCEVMNKMLLDLARGYFGYKSNEHNVLVVKYERGSCLFRD